MIPLDKSVGLGILGGAGLGLLMGSELSGTYATIAGAVLLAAFLVLMFLCRK